MKKVMISDEYLKQALEQSSRSLVGKTMKRMEIFNDDEQRKDAIKELIYEHYRDLKSILISFSVGTEWTNSSH